jgi:hypothetical protein
LKVEFLVFEIGHRGIEDTERRARSASPYLNQSGLAFAMV